MTRDTVNPAPSGASPLRVRAARRLLGTGATLAALGIVLSLGGGGDFPSVLAVLGLGLTVAGLHRVGRLGPDASVRPAARATTSVKSRS